MIDALSASAQHSLASASPMSFRRLGRRIELPLERGLEFIEMRPHRRRQFDVADANHMNDQSLLLHGDFGSAPELEGRSDASRRPGGGRFEDPACLVMPDRGKNRPLHGFVESLAPKNVILLKRAVLLFEVEAERRTKVFVGPCRTLSGISYVTKLPCWGRTSTSPSSAKCIRADPTGATETSSSPAMFSLLSSTPAPFPL